MCHARGHDSKQTSIIKKPCSSGGENCDSWTKPAARIEETGRVFAYTLCQVLSVTNFGLALAVNWWESQVISKKKYQFPLHCTWTQVKLCSLMSSTFSQKPQSALLLLWFNESVCPSNLIPWFFLETCQVFVLTYTQHVWLCGSVSTCFFQLQCAFLRYLSS